MSAGDRLAQVGLVVATAALGWLLMQALHEVGHVLHAWASGGVVERVELHPLAFSRTLLGVNPHPRFVAWGGALWGCLLPLAAVALARLRTPAPLAGVVRAIAGGCLLTNGVYLGAGAFVHVGDAGDLLILGASPVSLVLFGLVAAAGGLALWHGVGAAFAAPVDRRLALGVAGAAGAIAALELALTS